MDKNNLKKAVQIYKGLTNQQQNKLDTDFNTYKSTLIYQIQKINNMLASGFYNGKKLKWLYKLKNRYLLKTDLINYVLNKGYSYYSI